MNNWKTTAMGVFSIIAALGAVAGMGIEFLKTGAVPAYEAVSAAFAAIAAGFGLVFAKDATSQKP